MENIAFVVTKSEIGGAQTWTDGMMKLVKNECIVHLITSEPGWLTEEDSFDKLFIMPELKKHFSFIGYYKLLKYINDNNITVLVASSANAGIYSRLTKLIKNLRCIYVSHGWSCIYNGGFFKKAFIFVEKILSYLTDIVWCVSQSDEYKAVNVIGIKKNKIVTLSNSVPGLPGKNKSVNEKKVVFVGRLTHPKRPDILANVIAKHPDICLDVIGGGEYLHGLKTKFSKNTNIKFLGEIKGFNKYHEYDLFALVSESEGLPMSALEAHAAGIPLLMSDVGGCKELINENGLLIENNEQDVENKLLTIFNDYERFSSEAKREKSKFETDNYASRYKKLILG